MYQCHSRKGSLLSPPARLGRILWFRAPAPPPKVYSLLSESQNGRQELTYIVKNIFYSTAGVREQIYISTKSFVWLTLQLFFTVQVTKWPLGANLCNKKHIFAHWLLFGNLQTTMNLSFLSQDGSNELSHAQFHPTGSKTYRSLHLLLYR